jgi:hypothetical protein
VVRPPWPTSDAASSPIKTPRREKPKYPITFPEYIAIRRRCRPEIRRVQKLFPALMTHKYRGCIVVLSINKSVKPNEEQKVLTSDFDQEFTVNTSKRVFRVFGNANK